MRKFLLIEDSPLVVKIMRHLLKETSHLQCDVANSLAEAQQFLRNRKEHRYLAAVVDLNLPDAPNGEAVDLTLALKIPTLVLTGSMEQHIRDAMLEKHIVDYIIKESRYSYESAIHMVERLEKNETLTVMVVDDSLTSRNLTRALLERQRLNVVEAISGEEALEQLQKHPEVILMIVDYNMPGMNGIELVRNIRRDANKNNLVIIGISNHGNGGLSAQFIKNGANDFLTKPYSNEEFNCRIIHNIENHENIQEIKQLAYTDYLTQIPNRLSFYEQAQNALENANQNGTSLCMAMIDIDYFKKINDDYGHEAGDAVLKEFSAILSHTFNRFLIARTGGEEFSILLSGLSLDKTHRLLEDFRAVLEDQIITVANASVSITISIGLVENNNYTLEQLMRDADHQLHAAKDHGRNQICCDPL